MRKRSRCSKSGIAEKHLDLKTVSNRRSGLTCTFLFFSWTLFVLLNSVITDSEDEIGIDKFFEQAGDLIPSESGLSFVSHNGPVIGVQQGSTSIDSRCSNNDGVCGTDDQILDQFSTSLFQKEKHQCDESFSGYTIEPEFCNKAEEKMFKEHPVPLENIINPVPKNDRRQQTVLENGFVTSDGDITFSQPFISLPQGGSPENSQEQSSTLDLQKGLSSLLHVQTKGGAARYFIGGEIESADCLIRNLKGDTVRQRCLMARLINNTKYHHINDNIVDIHHICNVQSQYSNENIGADEIATVCQPNHVSGSCESLCTSSRFDWVEFMTSFCLCGSSLELFTSSSMRPIETRSNVGNPDRRVGTGAEFQLGQIEEFSATPSSYQHAVDSGGSTFTSGSSCGQNDCSIRGIPDTCGLNMQSEDLDGIQTAVQTELTRPTRVPPIGPDEYKKKAILEFQQVLSSKSDPSKSKVPHKLEPGGGEYNYAASSHGAKIMDSNTEAKGASNILEKDKDKYMRNPCNADPKFVIVELSEETLVDTLVIANYEFYSSNLKEFELLGSLTFPTDDWILLGNFEAENTRHLVRFNLTEPKWVRYLKLRMINHHGSEFFCTLSILEVYGVDAIERLLEDWRGEEEETRSRVRSTAINHSVDDKSGGISSDGAILHPENQSFISNSNESSQENIPGEYGRQPTSVVDESGKSTSYKDNSAMNSLGSNTGSSKGSSDCLDEGDKPITPENVPSVRPPGDSIMKMLMQKVKSLELSQLLFDQYLEDTNLKYSDMFNDLDQGIDVLGERLRNQTSSLINLAKRLHELNTTREIENGVLESSFALQVDMLHSELDILRSRIDHMETRELVALTLALLCMVVSGFLSSLYKCLTILGTRRSENHQAAYLCGFTVVLFVSSGLITLILSV